MGDAGAATPTTKTKLSFWGRRWFHVLLIVVSAIGARVPFYVALKPVWSSDTASYTLAYYFWAHQQFFAGERTPGYPIFLGLAQWVHGAPAGILLSFPVAYSVLHWQALLDIAAVVALYFVMRDWMKLRPAITVIASIFLVSLAGLCMEEMQLLNMSLSFAAVTAIVCLYAGFLHRIFANEKVFGLGLVLGIVMAVGVLIRPEILIFSVLLVVGTMALRFVMPERGVQLLSSALLMMLGLAPLLLLWMSWMYVGIGQFRITTLDGWNKSRTVYNLFDRVEPQDQALGRVLAHSYEVQKAHGRDVNVREHMFLAFDDLRAHYAEFPIQHLANRPGGPDAWAIKLAHDWFGFQRVPCEVANNMSCFENMRNKIDLGDYIGEVSTRLMLHHPLVWAGNAVTDWVEEGLNFDYVDEKPAVAGYHAITVDGSSYIVRPRLEKALEWVVRIEAPLLTAAYILTVGCLLFLRRLIRAGQEGAWMVVLCAFAAVGSIGVMCALEGFNRIYNLPYLSVFMLCATYLGNRLVSGSEG